MVYKNLVMEEQAFLDRTIQVHQLINGSESSKESDIEIYDVDNQDKVNADKEKMKQQTNDNPPAKKRGRPKKVAVTNDKDNTNDGEDYDEQKEEFLKDDSSFQ